MRQHGQPQVGRERGTGPCLQLPLQRWQREGYSTLAHFRWRGPHMLARALQAAACQVTDTVCDDAQHRIQCMWVV